MHFLLQLHNFEEEAGRARCQNMIQVFSTFFSSSNGIGDNDDNASDDCEQLYTLKQVVLMTIMITTTMTMTS